VVLIGLLLLGAGGGLALLWRQRALELYRGRLDAERERAWLRTVIARSLNEIYVFDATSFRFTFANDGACRNLGYTAEELLAMTVLDLKPGFTAAAFEQLVRPLREGAKPVLTVETVHRRKDGSEYPAEAHLQLVDSGRGPVFLAVVNDITERTRAETELNARNAELERFIYTVSHDLKSPLVTVKTFLGFLEQDIARAAAERIGSDVRYMRTAVDKMGGLLEDLLEMSRIGRVVAAPASASFAELAAEAVALVAGGIAARGVAVEIDPVEIPLRGDRARLVEIWQNLVENAVKFMGDQPAPRIRVGAERRGEEVVFFVRDNGVGIDPRYREKIFGLFERLDPAVEGTGLGLALVKRIVELYGGTIRAESDGPGRGAAFLFTLPGALVEPGPGAGGAREAAA
jgi:PAS domain S-box-containing protein